jgi:hypothetical protein
MTAQADEKAYADFPVTVKDYKGDAEHSVSYTGQIARQVLHTSLKKLAGQGNGEPNAELKAKMMAYYEAKMQVVRLSLRKPKATLSSLKPTLMICPRRKTWLAKPTKAQ